MYVYVFIQAYTYICIDICIRSETIGLKNLKISGLDGHRDLEHVLGRNGCAVARDRVGLQMGSCQN